MFKFLKKDVGINGFMSGELIQLENVNDPVFSEKMIGDGYAINPSENDVYAPVSGQVTVVFPSLHAYGIKMKNGTEVLIHLGLDTVELQGEGFTSYVQVNDNVTIGDKIASMDLELIKNKGYPLTSMFILTSGEKFKITTKDTHVSKDSIIGKII